jgi:hypothetical protein
MMRMMLGSRRLITATLALVTLVALSACSGGSDSTSSRQDRVAARGAAVMPFDQRRTTHVFRATTTGGVQRVVAKDAGDHEQITLVREHLRTEASRFRVGDFTDPMAIHGMQMPGLDVLRRDAARVQVTYTAIPRGAQISYTTAEPRLVTALHEWFDAQLMDHGSNAHS